jgi:hypothetical protein
MRQEERRHHPASGQCRVDLGCALGLDDLVLVLGDYRLRKVAVAVSGLRRERNLHKAGYPFAGMTRLSRSSG